MATDHPYTCVGCSLAFASTDAQRAHYSSDLHRYNAKRRIAGLSPVTADIYNQKIVERRQQIEQQEKAGSDRILCEACKKHFSSANAYQDHLNSRKHKEQQVRAIARSFATKSEETEVPRSDDIDLSSSSGDEAKPKSASPHSHNAKPSNEAMEVDTEDASAIQSLLAKKAESATRLGHLECLFCPRQCRSWQSKIKHMHAQHGFFIPDREYLTDEEGLVAHLAEIVAVWNICITCGLGFGQMPSQDQEGQSETEEKRQRLASRALDAVRKHMCAKNHCKILWDTEDQRLELSDFYDFSSSWADHNKDPQVNGADAEDWEDVDGDDASSSEEIADMVIDETRQISNDLPHQDGAKFGDTPFELVLPSGKRIGHRALRSFYKQNLMPSFNRQDAQEQRRLQILADAQSPDHADGTESNALVVPQRNGQLMMARNAGEAKWATKQDFAESKARSLFETKRGFVGNNQKHFRDPLLQ